MLLSFDTIPRDETENWKYSLLSSIAIAIAYWNWAWQFYFIAKLQRAKEQNADTSDWENNLA